jgi:hypothetical protein
MDEIQDSSLIGPDADWQFLEQYRTSSFRFRKYLLMHDEGEHLLFNPRMRSVPNVIQDMEFNLDFDVTKRCLLENDQMLNQ